MIGSIENSVRRTVTDLRGDGRGWSLVAVAIGWSLVVGGMLTLPALLPRIKAAFEISNATAGGAVTVLWLVYGVCQFPAGFVTDRIGERRMLLGSMAVGAVVVAWFAVTPSFVGFVVACGCLGIVGGLYATPRVTLLSRLYPERSGTALGTVMSMGNVGGAVFPATAGLVAAAYGWRAGFGAGVPLFLVAALAVWFAVPRERGRRDPESHLSLRELLPRLRGALRHRGILLVTAGVTLTFFTFQGLTAFLTTYLVSVKGLEADVAALMYGGLFTAAAVAQPIAGHVADEVGDKVVLIGITGLYAVLLVGLVAFGGFLLVSAIVVLLGIQRGATPVATANLAAALPEDIRGAGYGLLRTVFTGVSSTAAVVVGTLADADLFGGAFLLLAALAAVATGCYALLPSDA